MRLLPASEGHQTAPGPPTRAVGSGHRGSDAVCPRRKWMVAGRTTSRVQRQIAGRRSPATFDLVAHVRQRQQRPCCRSRPATNAVGVVMSSAQRRNHARRHGRSDDHETPILDGGHNRGRHGRRIVAGPARPGAAPGAGRRGAARTTDRCAAGPDQPWLTIRLWARDAGPRLCVPTRMQGQRQRQKCRQAASSQRDPTTFNCQAVDFQVNP